jgi:DNA (cytosine-5)-methyltransferase 1
VTQLALDLSDTGEPDDRPRLLDLYCCAGGAGKGYADAGFSVTGVDISDQPHYPFTFHQADAIAYVREHGYEFDVIHASPPCQTYLNLGAVNRSLGRSYDHDDLIAATRDALLATDKPYIIENVEDAAPELRSPVRICGTALGLPLRRHRLFESNIPIIGADCEHHRFTVPRYWTGWSPTGWGGNETRVLSTVVQVYGNAGGTDVWPEAMGIDWMTNAEMCEAIPPAYTRHIGEQLADYLKAVA